MADACVHLMNLPNARFHTLLGSGAKLNPSPSGMGEREISCPPWSTPA